MCMRVEWRTGHRAYEPIIIIHLHGVLSEQCSCALPLGVYSMQIFQRKGEGGKVWNVG